MFIENAWKPGELFDIPVSVKCSNSKRDFVWGWLKRFAWLVYSKFLDGAFCLPCVLFGVSSVGGIRINSTNCDTETFQYTNFYSCHPPGVTKDFIKGEA